MMPPPNTNASAPVSLLGAGLARTLGTIAREQGGAEGPCRTLERCIRQLVAANEAGHVCLPLDALSEDPDRLRADLLATGIVGTGEARLPLIIDAAGRLYLYRHLDYERRLTDVILRLAQADDAPLDITLARQSLTHWFAANATHLEAGALDDQKLAAAVALLRPLTTISGGPGTGKTTTVLAILATLLSVNPTARIVLAAPTGKAAARMLDAMRDRLVDSAARHDNPIDAALLERLPRQAYTIHRLLRPLPGSGRFRHDARHPLALDVLVVDEASMLDLALATKLFEALPVHARIILLGDKDQLAAVEAGAVFHALAAHPGLAEPIRSRVAQLCDLAPATIPARSSGPINGAPCIWLRRNFRFAADSTVGRLATILRDGGSDCGARLIAQWRAARDDASLLDCAAGPLPAPALQAIADRFGNYVAALQQCGQDAAALLRAFDAHRVLCVVRQGERGVERLNAEITQHLRKRLNAPSSGNNPWFAGRPVMLLENDYTLGLFNGDIGITLPGPPDRLQVAFPDGQGGVRPIAAARLRKHETAFACTVHKAQGSEFRSVSIVLPSHDTPLLTRELIYTAITRASHDVHLLGSTELLRKAAQLDSRRSGGLEDRLTIP